MNPRAKTGLPTVFGYYDKFQSKTVEFKPVRDELVVTFTPTDESEEASDASVASALASSQISALRKLNRRRGIAVFDVSEESESLDVASTLDVTEIANSIPAFDDSEGLRRYFIPDEVTVQFDQSISEADMELAIQELGSEVVQKQRTKGYYTVSVPEGRSLFDMIADFSQRDDVLFAEASEIGFNDELASSPNDPDFSRLWGLHNTGQTVAGTVGKKGVDVRALGAWDITRGDPDVIIAVIDTGADLTHPDLAGNILDRDGEDWDFSAADGSPDDSGSHGSHVCGTAAAVADDAVGIAGVAPKCQLMPLRINLMAGMNQNRADAINYVGDQAQKHANRRYVANCSWRASGNFSAILFAITNATDKGVLVIFAAGNANNDMDITPQYPAVYPDALAVAALDQNNRRASFSNYGSQVDVCAPGVNIWSTVPSSSHGFKNGTSMAAPHVAGVAALTWSANKNLTAPQVRQILQSTCEDVQADNPAIPGKLGSGRVNASRAVQKAVASGTA